MWRGGEEMSKGLDQCCIGYTQDSSLQICDKTINIQLNVNQYPKLWTEMIRL